MKTATCVASATSALLACLGLVGCAKSSTYPSNSEPRLGMDGPATVEVVPPVEAGLPDGGLDLPAAVEAGPGDAAVTETSRSETGTEAPAPVFPSAPTSCAIAVRLKASPNADGGGSGLPATHQFTLLVDWAGNTATSGAGGTANKVTLVQSGGAWTTQGRIQLTLSISPDENSASGRPYLTYERISIRPTVDGCAGSATGNYQGSYGDMVFTIPFEAELAGVVDQAGPSLLVFPNSKTEIHPLDLYGVASNELMPPGTSARWVAGDGTLVPMSSLPAGGALGVSGFLLKDRALAFASSYRLEVLPSAIDLVGNLTDAPPALATVAGPGLFSQDGFEGPLDALLGGKVKVIDASALPVPSGTKAIRFAPIGFGVSDEWNCDDRFTARLAVGPTAKVVKVSVLPYRSSHTGPFMAQMKLAVPNGAVSDFGAYWSSSNATPLPSPWSGPLPGASQNTYGDLAQIELALPAGIGKEVIVDIRRPCFEAGLPGDGLVIDDLRVE